MTRGYMKDDISYAIVHFQQDCGSTDNWVYRQIDWAIILSEKLDEQLVGVKDDPKFYMTSYLVYLLVARKTDYLGLYKKGSMQDVNSQPYVVYPQLVKKNLSDQSKEFGIVNDAFIFAIIHFIEGDYAKRISIEATKRIENIGTY